MNTSDLKSFNYLENGEVAFSCFDTIKSNKILDKGCYKLGYLGYPENRVVIKVDEDKETVKVHDFPDKYKLDALFNSFFSLKTLTKITSLGFNHKIGILLYGKEGTGKSTITKYYYSKAVRDHNALVFQVTTSDEYVSKCWEFIANVRRIQNNPIIVVFEEFDAFLERNINESFLKTVLDGNMSINNCVFMATTNYLEKIPEAMKNRPSRFKYVLNIEGIHTTEGVYTLVKGMLGDLFSEDDMNGFASNLKGETLDMIKQFCIDKIMAIQHYPVHRKVSHIGFKKEEVYEQ